MSQFLIAVCLVIGIYDAYLKMSRCPRIDADSQPEYAGLLDFVFWSTNK